MTDRVHVKAELELFVDDTEALRQSAFERLRSAWSGDDEFPYDSPDDVPLDQVVASVLADALPIELAGARRSALKVEAESRGADDDQNGDEADDNANDDEADDEADDDDADEDDKAEDESDRKESD